MPSHPGDPSIGASLPAAAAVERVGEELARSHEGALGETQVMQQQGRRTDDVATTSGGLALASKRRRTTASGRQPSAAANTSVRLAVVSPLKVVEGGMTTFSSLARAGLATPAP
jgi:hypothetical protein